MTADDRLFQLAGKVALITGGGNGLGREFALGLAARGARVLCVDRDRARAEAVCAEIVALDGTAEALTADVSDEASVAAMAHDADAIFGRVDVLVNNAGIATVPMRTHEMPVADWDRLMAVNLRGVFLCTRAIIPMMLRHASGSIINIASVIGMSGFYPGFPTVGANYSAAKAAVIGFTRQAAVEYAPENIRVNAIAPGYHGGTQLGAEYRSVATPAMIERHERAVRERIPMGRRGLTEELRGLAVFLASDASRYVTGQTIAHDGGWTAI